MDFKQINELEEKLIDLLGFEELYNAVSKWLGYGKLEEILADICNDYDIPTGEEEEEEEDDDDEDEA
jgi:hypothetical protein